MVDDATSKLSQVIGRREYTGSSKNKVKNKLACQIPKPSFSRTKC